MRSLYAVLLLAGMALAPARAAVVYVDRDAPGPTRDGKSWATAFVNVNAAANAATTGDELWVAEGVYNTLTISLRPGVGYYGGFAGTETARAQADPEQHPTVLDAGRRNGLIGATETIGRDTVVDGFTLANTLARGGGPGGAIACLRGGAPIVRRCLITGNESWGNGVLYLEGAPLFEQCAIRDNAGHGAWVNGTKAAPVFVDCAFTDNDGAALTAQDASLTMTACTIAGNSGGLSASRSHVTLERCEVRGNSDGGLSLRGCPEATVRACRITGNAGAGIGVYDTPALIASNVIADNLSLRGSAGIWCGPGAPIIVNNTIVGHRGPEGAAILLFDGTSGPPVAPVIRNNILADNAAGVRVWPYTEATLFLSLNCVWNNDTNYSGLPDPTGTNGNIAADPKLVRPDDGNFHIQPSSPCRDAGGGEVGIPEDIDIDGQPRVVGPRVDIGADESDGTTWTATSRVVHVHPTGDDANDGSDWTKAKRTVGAALATFTDEGGEAWLADGVYEERVTLPPYTRLYGGFAGTETARRPYPDSLFASGTILDGGAGGSVVTVSPGGVRGVVQGLVIRNGRSAYGAGVLLRAGADVTILNSVLRDNMATSDDPNHRSAGGGLAAGNASATLRYNRIAVNRAARGAGVYLALGYFTLVGNTIAGNEAVAETAPESSEAGSGGGLLLSFAAVTMTGNVVEDNRAATGGGLLFRYQYDLDSRIQRNTFRDNTASVAGGGAFLGTGGRQAFSSNVLTGNRAGERGGGLSVGFLGSPVVNNTFADNEAPLGGAIHFDTPPRLVANNVVAFNSSGLSLYYEPGWYYPPDPLRVSDNLFFANAAGDYSGPPEIPDPTTENGNLKADPLFADCAAENYHLLPGSPAIDAGTDIHVQPADTDRDGNPRIRGRHVDLGAYETPGIVGYRWWDVLRALRLAGGLEPGTPEDWRLNVSGNPRQPWAITLADAARLARKASGLEP